MSLVSDHFGAGKLNLLPIVILVGALFGAAASLVAPSSFLPFVIAAATAAALISWRIPPLLALAAITPGWALGDAATVVNSLLVAAFGFRILAAGQKCRRLTLGWPELWLVAFLCSSVVANLRHPDPLGVAYLAKLLLGAALYFLASAGGPSILGSSPQRVAKVVVIAGIILLAVVIFVNLFIWHSPFLSVGFAAPTSRRGENQVALYLASLFGLSFLVGDELRGVPVLLARAFIGLGLVYTLSRGAIVSVILAVLALLAGRLVGGRRRESLSMLVWIIVSVLVLGAAGYALPNVKQVLAGRFAQLSLLTQSNALSSGALGRRGLLIGLAVREFLKNPVIGNGAGSFLKASTAEGLSLLTHNDYLNLLVEQGLVGFITFVGFLVANLLYVARRSGPGPTGGFTLPLLILSAYLLFINAVQMPMVWFVFALVRASVCGDSPNRPRSGQTSGAGREGLEVCECRV